MTNNTIHSTPNQGWASSAQQTIIDHTSSAILRTQQYISAKLNAAEDTTRKLNLIEDIVTKQIKHNNEKGIQANPTIIPELTTALSRPSIAPTNPPGTSKPQQPSKDYWHQQRTTQEHKLTRNITVYTTLLEMRALCTSIEETDTLGLISLTQQATAEGNSTSVWKLFRERYKNITYFETCKALLLYLFYYKTSLISHVAQTYLGSFIKKTTDSLTTENSTIRSTVFRESLENLNGWLVEDLRARRAYANALSEGEGDLATYRKRAIEKFYGFVLSNLCKQFSEKLTENAPEVPLLKDAQSIPMIGSIFRALQWLINRFIIQRGMRSWILPQAIESVIKNGVGALKPERLPFTLSLTQFLNEQLLELRGRLNTESLQNRDQSLPQLPGTELLGPCIQELLKIVHFRQYKTTDELRQAFARYDAQTANTMWAWLAQKWAAITGETTVIQPSIENGVLEGGNTLFNYLDETAASGELFAHLLEIASAPFSRTSTDLKTLQANYAAEEKKLRETSGSIVKKIIHSEVEHWSSDTNIDVAKKNKQLAERSFDEAKRTTLTVIGKLDNIFKQIKAKIQTDPINSNSIDRDLNDLFQITQAFTCRPEVRPDNEPNLNYIDKDAIRRKFNPLYEKMAEIAATKPIRLQILQEQYTAHTAIANHLQTYQETLRSMQNQPTPQLSSVLHQCLEEIAKQQATIPPNSKVKLSVQKLGGYTQTISERVKTITDLQRTMDASTKLNELLKQWHATSKFKFFGRYPNDIRKYFALCSNVDQEALRPLIQGRSTLEANWNRIQQIIQNSSQRNTAIQTINKENFLAAAQEALTWTNEDQRRYTQLKNDNRQKMSNDIETLLQDTASLNNELNQSTIRLGSEFSSSALTSAGVGIAIGTVAAIFMPEVTAISLGLAGSVALKKYWTQCKRFCARQFVQRADVEGRIIKIFEGMHDVCIDEHFSHGMSTRAMKVYSTSKLGIV